MERDILEKYVCVISNKMFNSTQQETKMLLNEMLNELSDMLMDIGPPTKMIRVFSGYNKDGYSKNFQSLDITDEFQPVSNLIVPYLNKYSEKLGISKVGLEALNVNMNLVFYVSINLKHFKVSELFDNCQHFLEPCDYAVIDAILNTFVKIDLKHKERMDNLESSIQSRLDRIIKIN